MLCLCTHRLESLWMLQGRERIKPREVPEIGRYTNSAKNQRVVFACLIQAGSGRRRGCEVSVTLDDHTQRGRFTYS